MIAQKRPDHVFEFLSSVTNEDCAFHIQLMIHAPRIQAAIRGHLVRNPRFPEAGRLPEHAELSSIAQHVTKWDRTRASRAYMYAFSNPSAHALLQFCEQLRPGCYDVDFKFENGGSVTYVDERVTVLPLRRAAFHAAFESMHALIEAHTMYYGACACVMCIRKSVRV